MINRKTLGIAGAAILGTVVGTSPAYAQITINASGMTVGAPTFARESLTTVRTAANRDYYVVTGATALQTIVPVPVTKAATDSLKITIDAENMIFLGSPPSFGAGGAAALDLLDGSDTQIAAAETDFTTTTALRDGDTSVTFILGGSQEITEAQVSSRVRRIGFSINNMGVRDGVDGSFRVTITNQTHNVSRTTTVANAIKTARGLRVTNEDASTGQPQVVAGVEWDFTRFTGTPGGSTVARLGGYTVDLMPATIRDAGGNTASLADVMSTTRSRIGGMGDVSFADDVYLDTSRDCDSPSGSIVSLLADDGAWKAERARPAISGNESGHLCIKVDGDTTVPEAGYGLVLDFEPAAGSVFPPADQTLQLGNISHDAAEASIPYVTTSDGYNQRIVLTNSWGQAASYTITFTTEEGVTAEATDAATGEIAAGMVKVLRMADLVRITEGTRAAADVVVEAPQGRIGVATTQVNVETGTTDTVVYDVN